MHKDIYRKKSEIVTRKIAGELFLIPVHGKLADMQKIFALTPVAEFVWDKLDGKINTEEISNEILNSFDVQKEEADADLKDFLGQLSDAHLIEKVND